MPFDEALRSRVDDYATAHLPGDLTWHTRFFDFLHCDPTLKRKLGEMFYSTRYLYKILEGLAPGDEDWALETEVRLQVLNYASIYEACLHHLLFEEASSEPEVLQLTRQRTLRPFQVSGSITAKVAEIERLIREVEADLSAVKTMGDAPLSIGIQAEVTLREDRVRFPHKADAAVALGMISPAMRGELVDIYDARNKIHLHAEIRAGGEVFADLQFARNAYWRLEGFRGEIIAWRKRSRVQAVDAAELGGLGDDLAH